MYHATAAQVARIAGHLINSLTAREAALAAGIQQQNHAGGAA